MKHTKLSKLQKMIIQELAIPQSRKELSTKISTKLNARHSWKPKRGTDYDRLHARKRIFNQQTQSFMSSFSRSLKRLKQRGLIEVYGSWDRRHYYNVRLTDEGYIALEELKKQI